MEYPPPCCRGGEAACLTDSHRLVFRDGRHTSEFPACNPENIAMLDAGVLPTTKQEIQRKYEHFARWYDVVEGILEALGIRRLRRELLQKATGQILEVAAGTGKNLRYYPKGCQVTAEDLTLAMLSRARRRALGLHLDVSFGLMDAESLACRDHSFDTVVSTLSLCTFIDPLAALREMARVCRPGGRILLLEHGRSDRETIARWQDRWADRHAKRLGCHWNRQPLELVQQAGLTLHSGRHTCLGVFYSLEASP
jgi:ubiquinone/menaquinone biosynthesis C-methylase UbiE